MKGKRFDSQDSFDQKIDRILPEVFDLFSKKPPTIAVIGVSGAGKSSAINSLFGTKLDISHTQACTKEFQSVKLMTNSQNNKGKKLYLQIYDAPGLGEELDMDNKYLAMYEKYLPSCDVILYLISARNRAIALDQQYIRKFRHHHKKMVIAISQVDLVDPIDWYEDLNIPSKSQERNISEIISDRQFRLGKEIGVPLNLTCFSAKKGYNLETLFHELLSHCRGDRAWLFDAIKGFSYKDFQDF